MIKIIKSLMTISLVAALAIGGTMAYFSSTKTSEGNVFAAGTLTLDLSKVTGTSFPMVNMAPGESDSQAFELKNSGTIDGDHTEMKVSYNQVQSVTADTDANTSDVDWWVSGDTIDASVADTTLTGSVDLQNFESSPGSADDVWYEAGLVSNEAYETLDDLHNKGVYMIANYTGDGTHFGSLANEIKERYLAYISNVPGTWPCTTGNYIGDQSGYNSGWGDAGKSYFMVPVGEFGYELKYHDVSSDSGKVDLRISVGGNWSPWKYYKYAEDDLENNGYTHQQAVDYGYATDDDLTNARIVSQIFEYSATSETFRAVLNGDVAATNVTDTIKLADIGDKINVTVWESTGSGYGSSIHSGSTLAQWNGWTLDNILDTNKGIGWVKVELEFDSSAGNEYQRASLEIDFDFTLNQDSSQ